MTSRSQLKILYLTFCESVLHNGIYETQVKQLLCRLAVRYRRTVTVSHYAFLPALQVGRRGITNPFFAQRRGLTAVKNEFRRSGVHVSLIFVPAVMVKRWAHYLPFVCFLLFLSIPILMIRILRQRPDIIHCRSYAATLLALAAKTFFPRIKVIFDPRGFLPEEGVVVGHWNRASLPFRLWKHAEHYLFRRSDKSIALSELFAQRISGIAPGSDCDVVYACADLQQFRAAQSSREEKRLELGISGKTVFIYNGSLHAWHDPVLMARLMHEIRQGFVNSKLLVVTKHPRDKLEDLLRRGGLSQDDYCVVAADSRDVPRYLAASDYGLVPLRDIGDQEPGRIVADTMIGLKVTEYLAAGLPIIVNRHVRGLHSLMSRIKIGVFFDPEDLAGVVPAIRHLEDHLGDVKLNCSLAADQYLSLDVCAQSYYKIYEQLGRQHQTLKEAISNPA